MDTGRIAYKYRLLPDEAQREYLSRCFGCVRFVYNRYVEFSLSEYRRVKAEGGEYRRLPEVSALKEESPFLREADSLALANAKRNFEAARKAWWDSLTGRRKGRRMRAPAFKKKGKCRDSYTTNNQNGTVSVSGDRIRLPKIGDVRLVRHRDIPEGYVIKSTTVSRERDGSYWVSVLCDTGELPVEQGVPGPDARVVGLDMSMSEFYVSSDGGHDATRTKYVRQYRSNEKKTARASRTMHRRRMNDTGKTVYSKKKGREVPLLEPSRNREKARLRLARLHRRIANRRRDFAMQEAARLAKAYDVIVVEDLDMQAMARTLSLGKSANDLGWGMFVRFLEWQCGKRGKTLVRADKWFPSSKTCSHCGAVNHGLTLSDREWVCPECGCVIDRDHNAACNLRDWFLGHAAETYNTAGTAGIYACGDSASTPGLRPEASGVAEAGSPFLRQ